MSFLSKRTRKKTKNRHIVRQVFLAVLLCAFFAEGCTAVPEPSLAAEAYRDEAFYLDTFCQITVYAVKRGGRKAAEMAVSKAWEECAAKEKLLSKTAEGSDVWRINHADGGWVTCDPYTVSLVKKALAFGDRTEGAFDVTLGAIESLYDFHADSPKIPEIKAVQELLSHTGWQKVETEGENVRLTDPEALLDLGGIAKGAIADTAAACLADAGVTSALVNLGGNLVLIGDKAGRDFHIGIEKPFSEEGEVAGVLSLQDATVVTSGTYKRYFRSGGRIWHHILDPKTGYPAESGIDSVTVVSGRGHSADCDALSTACLILGLEDGMALIRSIEGFEAVFIDAEGNCYTTEGLDLEPAP